MAGHGDSGGPFYQYVPGRAAYYAAGTFSGGSGTMPCRRYTGSGSNSRTCFSTTWYTDARAVMNQFPGWFIKTQ